jgi:macrolide-specific efflux system membrane fusion protein
VQPGDAVVRLLRINPLRAEGFLRARDLRYKLEKQPVKLQVILPGETRPTSFEGRVVFVDPEIDPVNSQVRVWAEIDNSSDRLRPGMRGDMAIVPAAGKR